LDFFAGWLVPNLNQILVEWCGLVRGESGGVRIKNGHNGLAFGGVLCRSLKMGENGVVSYQQVRERESERSTLITDRRENE